MESNKNEKLSFPSSAVLKYFLDGRRALGIPVQIDGLVLLDSGEIECYVK